MAFPILGAAAGGLSILSSLFGGGGKQTTTFNLSPEARAFLNKLLGEYPLEQQQALLRQAFAPYISERFRRTRQATAPLGSAQQAYGQFNTENDIFNQILQASIQNQAGIRGDIGSLLGRTGSQTQQTQVPFGSRVGGAFGNISEMLASIIGMQEYGKIMNPNAQYPGGQNDYYGTQGTFGKLNQQYKPQNPYQYNSYGK